MSYTVTSNGTIEFDWENRTPEEIRAELAKQESDTQEFQEAA